MRRLDPYSPRRDDRDGEAGSSPAFVSASLPFWPEGYPQTDWEHLFAMQHFGVPTRLLDWSEGAMMATFFAADHDSTRCECGRGACKPTLWVLDPIGLNRRNSRLDGYGDAISVLATSDEAIEAWSPEDGGNALRTMAGRPLRHSQQPSHRCPAGHVHRLQARRTLRWMRHRLSPRTMRYSRKKITLDASHADVMRSLRVIGVTRAAVYPDLSSLSADIATTELAT